MNKKVRTVLNDKNLNEASKILKLHVSNENQMTQLARILAPLLPQKGVLLINGIMGSGKTFLCRNFIQAKQENEKKKHPPITFWRRIHSCQLGNAWQRILVSPKDLSTSIQPCRTGLQKKNTIARYH